MKENNIQLTKSEELKDELIKHIYNNRANPTFFEVGYSDKMKALRELAADGFVSDPEGNINSSSAWVRITGEGVKFAKNGGYKGEYESEKQRVRNKKRDVFERRLENVTIALLSGLASALATKWFL